MRKMNKQIMEQTANRKATWIVLAVSVAIAVIIRKYGREKKD